MAVDTSKVRVALTGAVSVAIVGSTAPTDASTALAAAFKDVGGIDDKGVTESPKRSTKDIKLWQGGVVARTTVTDSTYTVKFVMVETQTRSQALYYGTTPAATSLVVNPANSGGRQAFVLDVIDGTNLKRIYIPQGEVTDKDDIAYDNEDPAGYGVTITAYYDSTIGGVAKVFYDTLAA